jgi:hypothetical protein
MNVRLVVDRRSPDYPVLSLRGVHGWPWACARSVASATVPITILGDAAHAEKIDRNAAGGGPIC